MTRRGKKRDITQFDLSKYLLWIFAALIAASIFKATSILVFIGMLPTIVAVFVDSHPKKMKALTVGAMNMAGCFPFLLELWSHGHSVETSLEIVADPMTVIIMYMAAGVGYVLDWVLTGLISGLLYQRGVARQKSIRKRQEDLVERWGHKVTGEAPMDANGMPIEEGAGSVRDR